MEKDFFDEIVVVKRSGQRVNFNDAKVAIAVKKGFDSVYEEYDEKLVNKVKVFSRIYINIFPLINLITVLSKIIMNSMLISKV